MKRTIFATLAFLVLLALSAPAFSEPNFEEGKWEVTMKMDIQGLPFALPPVKNVHCITKEESVPQKPEKDMECEMLDTKTEGDTVSWVMRCTGKDGKVESHGKITYKGTSFDGVMNVTVVDPKGQKSDMKQIMSGKRIGPCD